MVSMQNITSKNPDFANAFLMKRNISYTVYKTSALPLPLLLGMIHASVLNVAP